MTFGEKLQSLRQKAGMSQDALAEKLNVSRQAVSRWEREETMPETDKVVLLADLFAVTTDYLLREQAEPETQPEPESPRGTWNRLGDWVKTKGYLLGWLPVVWGVACLAATAVMAYLQVQNRRSARALAEITGVSMREIPSAFPGGGILLVFLFGVMYLSVGIWALRAGKRSAKRTEKERR